MIKKKVFEDDLIIGMDQELNSKILKQATLSLNQAADYLQAALEIFEESGLHKSADQVLHVLTKIANKHVGESKHKHPKDPTKIPDSHTKNLTPDKQIQNLKNHGTVFNMVDDGASDDLLDVDIDDDLEVHDFDPQRSFED